MGTDSIPDRLESLAAIIKSGAIIGSSPESDLAWASVLCQAAGGLKARAAMLLNAYEADMFWNEADAEFGYESIDEIVTANHAAGDRLTILRARRLDTVEIEVVDDGEGGVTWRCATPSAAEPPGVPGAHPTPGKQADSAD